MTIMTGLTPNTMTLLMSEDGVVTGNEIVITEIEGLDATNMRRESTARLMGDGDFTEKGNKGGKVITISGDAVFETRREAKEFVMDLLAFLSDGGVGALVAIDEDLGLTRTTYVELNTLEEPVINGTSVSFTYDLYAADPAKYGDPVTFEAPSIVIPGLATSYETLPKNQVRVFNRTSSAGYVFMKATADLASPIVTELASMVEIGTPGLSLATGERIEFNALDKTVFHVSSTGVRTQYNGVADEKFTVIPAGQSRVFEVSNDVFTAASGSNDVTVEFTIIGDTIFNDVYTATYNNLNGNPDVQVISGYAANEQEAGIATATNTGTADVDPVFIVTGNYPDGVAIINRSTGDRVAIGGSVNASTSSPLTINARTGRATLGATSVTTRLTYREWSVIKGKSSTQYELSYLTTGTATQTLKIKVEPKWH